MMSSQAFHQRSDVPPRPSDRFSGKIESSGFHSRSTLSQPECESINQVISGELKTVEAMIQAFELHDIPANNDEDNCVEKDGESDDDKPIRTRRPRLNHWVNEPWELLLVGGQTRAKLRHKTNLSSTLMTKKPASDQRKYTI
ncbi:hypothetical protein ACFFSY_19030 [Paenibacillus aurantiacus]|uniref:Uncharacterized protein n=1 Tax=Paenibacillus aurantiacus TaxID=1936118 RepID=A0ABV5KS29_9BACL